MSIATSLNQPHLTSCLIIRKFITDCIDNCFRPESIPFSELYEHTMNTAAHVYRDTLDYAGLKGYPEPVQFLVTCSNFTRTEVKNVSHLTVVSSNPEVCQIKRIVVINYRDLVAFFSIIHAALRNRNASEGQNALVAVLLLIHLSRAQLSSYRNYLYGMLGILSKYLRFQDLRSFRQNAAEL